tara:strand:- start:48 stop:365 length:318 start_codon:yes stop_codon:yes gene_type:complete
MEGFTTFLEAQVEAKAILQEAVQVLTASNVWGGVGKRMEENFSRRQDEFHAKCNLFFMQAETEAEQLQWLELNNNTYQTIQGMKDHQTDARQEKIWIKRPRKNFY